jgi:hypothetical protein
LWTVCYGWPLTVIFPISASQVARIIGVSHRSPVSFCVLFIYLLWYWGLNSRPTPWASPPALSLFEIGSYELFAQAGFEPQSSWSASWVARTVGIEPLVPGASVF